MSTISTASLILNTAPEAYDAAGLVVQSLMDNGVLIDDDGARRLQAILRDELEGRELTNSTVRDRAARAAAERLFRVTPGTSTPSVENATLKFQGAIDAVVTATLESLADLAADEAVDAAEQRIDHIADALIDAGVLEPTERRLFSGSLSVELSGADDEPRIVRAHRVALRAARGVVSRRTGYGPGNEGTTVAAEAELQVAIRVAILATA